MRVRWVPPTEAEWPTTVTDYLAGTAEYGDLYDDAVAYAIPFSTLAYDKFLFTNGVFTKWVIATKASYDSPVNDLIQAEKTSLNSSPH
jgi:hypothetical protein